MKVMIYEGPRRLKVDEVPDFPLGENQIRVQTMYSGISHGTEMNVYRGVAPFFRRKQGEGRLFRDAETKEKWTYPIKSCDPGVWYMGYANVGKVIEVGSNVKDLIVGDIVYSHSSHQSQLVMDQHGAIKLPENIKPEYGVFFTNLMTTFNGILDTRIKLGDTVVISGLGVLGQLLIQMSKMSGAFRVIGVDVFEKRLRAALENGADYVFSPKTCDDVALEIRKLTGMKGADVVIEVSGNPKALNEAIRIAAPDTTITALGWYQGQCTALDLSEEFHHNRVSIKCSQTCTIDPQISHMWTHDRKVKSCLELLGKLKLDNLINKIPFDDVASAYEMVDKDPKDIIQVVLTY